MKKITNHSHESDQLGGGTILIKPLNPPTSPELNYRR